MSKVIIGVVAVLVAIGIWLGIRAAKDDTPEVSPSPTVSQSPVVSATPDEDRDGK